MSVYIRSTRPQSTTCCALNSHTMEPTNMTASSATSSSTSPGESKMAAYSSKPCSWHVSVMSKASQFKLAKVPKTSTMRSLPGSSSFISRMRSTTYGVKLRRASSLARATFRITLNASGSRNRIPRRINASKPLSRSGPETTCSHIISAHFAFVVTFTASAMSSGASCRSSTCKMKSRSIFGAGVYANMPRVPGSTETWYRSAMDTC
mmetsp:Transcript_12985/g.54919  ORF Transcript_12985/g.54919 Transcript_12985/m.54919 type:complete len:207 (+) Transcript_12985:627-1247(+)